MIYFNSDYMEGAHPLILKRLAEMNLDKNEGYGEDSYCRSAAAKIARACGRDDVKVRFLVGGTQTNAIVIDSILRHNEGVVAVQSGHINVHEAGAIEACGHKVLAIEGKNGKIVPSRLDRYLTTLFGEDYELDHIVVPKMVYISHPTEYGTTYTLAELTEIRHICDRFALKLFVDGARLGYGLTAPGADITLPQLARLAHVFYIGGTKVGALMGEAVVITDPDIRITTGAIKNRGALLAKGWLLGMQFDTLFTDDLYLRISRNAIDRAMQLRDALSERGYRFYIDSPTNQQFVILEDKQIEALAHEVGFNIIEKTDDTHTVVRFATSWATTPEQVEELLSHL